MWLMQFQLEHHNMLALQYNFRSVGSLQNNQRKAPNRIYQIKWHLYRKINQQYNHYYKLSVKRNFKIPVDPAKFK